MKILNIVETAYRATIEEQDDTVLWLSHILKNSDADLDVLLQGNAVNYVVAGQDASGLNIGHCSQTQPPEIVGDVEKLMATGCKVLVVSEDLDERGITVDMMMKGPDVIGRADLPGCFEQYQRVWHW